ncbi:peptidylprolyl isomerase [Desertihabitans aurantiacus]|uniref:peptidylprolyl isomerase n=1 Tax=Desertihabitans aurantiacus TaxID=2282477 RepID=UPI0018E525AB|nr:peptidylprolyl isomerase [Desertihabitans aurantiacus]
MLKRTFPLLLAAGVVVLGACSPPESSLDDAPSPEETAGAPQGQESAPVGALCEYLPEGQPSRPVDPPSSEVETTGEVVATIETNQGPVTVTMDRGSAPCAVHSFVSLATQGFYDDTVCHRLSDSGGLFMLQCGDPTATGSGGPGYRFAEELTGQETYGAGTVAMARTTQPASTGSQFFLVYEDSQLSPDYTVLGTMDEASIGVVARIATEGQDGSFGQVGGGKPNNPSEISTVTVG